MGLTTPFGAAAERCKNTSLLLQSRGITKIVIVAMVISDSLQNANVTFTRRKVWTYTSGDARQREGTEEKQVYQLRKNDGYEAVMCQVDRFFLLLTSFARHILGDDDNAFVHCIKCTELHPRCRGSGSRLNAKLYVDVSEIIPSEGQISRLDNGKK